MSERYSRLFTLPENLYAVGSPVVIAAGTLLKDNQTGKIVAQLKLKSISNKPITAVKVELYLFDTAGNYIEESVVHDYLDLDASRDLEFAQKAPVPIPNSKARSYKASVTEVVFADRSVWNANGGNWEPLKEPSFLMFEDHELRKQYEIKFGKDSIYNPRKEKDLWYCTCGALNHEGENCHSCHTSLLELQSLDLSELAKEKDARLEAEAKQAAEQKAVVDAQKRKTAKILKIVIPAVSTVIAFVILLNSVIIPNGKYNKAISLMEAGQYKDAIAAFEAMDGYKDSADKIKACETAILDGKYNNAVALMEAGQYEEAITAFEALDRYKDSADKVAECAMLEEKPAYEAAVALEESGEKARAAIAFAKLTAYPDAKKQSFALWDEVAVRDTVCDSYNFTIGLKADSTVIATGNENIKRSFDLDDAERMTGITAVAAGRHHYILLLENGTVKTGGSVPDDCGYEHFALGNWSDIVAISAKHHTSMGLKYDGTVVVGVSNHDVDVSDWTDIVAISAGSQHIVGLKANGTVVAKYVGKQENKYGSCCDVSAWRDVVAISAGSTYTLALKSDGTVLFAGDMQSDLHGCREWEDIVAISAGSSHAVGLRSDGTVVAIGSQYDGKCDVSNWADIVAVSANHHTIGIRSNGTVVAVGDDDYGLVRAGVCRVGGWKDIKIPN